MNFNYYSFVLNGEERIFYTYVILEDKKDILLWAVRYDFIKEGDMEKCSSVRSLPLCEVKARNKELYKKWWNEHKNDSSLSGKIPLTIGKVQLN